MTRYICYAPATIRVGAETLDDKIRTFCPSIVYAVYILYFGVRKFTVKVYALKQLYTNLSMLSASDATRSI